MANVYRLIYQFTAPQGSRWNELYYFTGNSPTDAAIVPQGNGTAARLNMLTPSCVLRSVTSTDVANPRSVTRWTLNWLGTYPVALAAGSAPETSLVCNLVGVSGSTRKLWMRGVPAQEVETSPSSGISLFSARFQSYFRSMITNFAASGRGIRKLTPTLKYTITSIAAGPATGQTVITYNPASQTTPPSFAVGSMIIIRKTDPKQLPALKGSFTIIAVGSNTITVPYQLPYSTVVTGNLGYVRQQAYNSVDIFNPVACSLAYWGSHATKVFTQGSRGARRAPRIRLSL
jgi:hypothetical protein